MLFKDIYQMNSDSSIFVNTFNTYGEGVAEWFYYRFKNYELLYDEETFRDLWRAMLIENHIELLKIKKLMEQQEMWVLGNVVDTTSDITNVSNSNGAQSYQGYNVEGDFSKNSSDVTLTGNTTGKTSSINNTDEFNKLIEFDYSKLLDKIYDKFVVLFVLVL